MQFGHSEAAQKNKNILLLIKFILLLCYIDSEQSQESEKKFELFFHVEESIADMREMRTCSNCPWNYLYSEIFIKN